ncbi:hypothetical protein JCM16303_000648 [Sporobolomyces ruberrimus]
MRGQEYDPEIFTYFGSVMQTVGFEKAVELCKKKYRNSGLRQGSYNKNKMGMPSAWKRWNSKKKDSDPTKVFRKFSLLKNGKMSKTATWWPADVKRQIYNDAVKKSVTSNLYTKSQKFTAKRLREIGFVYDAKAQLHNKHSAEVYSIAQKYVSEDDGVGAVDEVFEKASKELDEYFGKIKAKLDAPEVVIDTEFDFDTI